MTVSFASTINAFEDPSCPKCGGTKPTCCSCPSLTINQQAQELVDRWLVDRRLLDQAFITTQDRQSLAERITQSNLDLQSQLEQLRAENERLKDPCVAAGYHVCGRLEHEHLTKGQP